MVIVAVEKGTDMVLRAQNCTSYSNRPVGSPRMTWLVRSRLQIPAPYGDSRECYFNVKSIDRAIPGNLIDHSTRLEVMALLILGRADHPGIRQRSDACRPGCGQLVKTWCSSLDGCHPRPLGRCIEIGSFVNPTDDQADSAGRGCNTNDRTHHHCTRKGPFHHAEAGRDGSNRGDEQQCPVLCRIVGENKFQKPDQNGPDTDQPTATKAVWPGQKTAASATATPARPRILAARFSITPKMRPNMILAGSKTAAIPNANP